MVLLALWATVEANLCALWASRVLGASESALGFLLTNVGALGANHYSPSDNEQVAELALPDSECQYASGRNIAARHREPR